MALFKFLSAIFKKIAKLFGGAKGKKGKPVDDRLPGERRIGIYGPSSVGKSVFFTMLYQACSMSSGPGGRRAARDFNLSPANQQTGALLKNNLDTLRGGEWLPGTVEESGLEFKATLQGGKQFPFSTRDYKGETVDLEQEGAAREKLIEYFRNCDGILFMIAPEMIKDSRKCEREIMSFTAMINQVTDESGKGLKIPIGLMVTKADEIEGFENDSQVELVSRKSEYLKAKDFDEFVEGVCGQYHVARNIVFQEQVRNLMYEMTMFFDFLMTLSMEFQVFFVSSVGHVRKVETTPGKIVARPPENPAGIGVEKPFLWVVDTIKRKERIARINAVRRFVFAVSAIILLFFAIPYAIHLLGARTTLDQMRSPEGQNQYTSETIEQELQTYASSTGVKLVSGLFAIPGTQAPETERKAERLVAYWQLHRQLAEEMPGWATREQLARIASPAYRGKERWEGDAPKPSWYTRVGDRQVDLFDQSATALVDAYNYRRMGDLLVQVRTAGGSSSAEACATRTDLFLEPPTETGAFDQLAQELADSCEVWNTSGEVGKVVREAVETFRAVLQPFESGAVVPADVDAGIEKMRVFLEGTQRLADQPRVSQQRERAAALQTLLRTARRAAGMADRDDREGYIARLSEVRRDAGSQFPEIRDWASDEIGVESRSQRRQTQDEVKASVERILGSPERMVELLDPRTVQTLENAGLSGDEGQAVREYKAAFEQLRDQGVRLELGFVQVPPNFVVVAYDNREQTFREDQAIANSTLTVTWRADEDVFLGLLRSGEIAAQACKSRALSVKTLIKGEVDTLPFDDCGATLGVPVVVRAPQLRVLIDERLAAPLRRGFGL